MNPQAIVAELRRWHSLKGVAAFLEAAEAIERMSAELDTRLSGYLARALRADVRRLTDERDHWKAQFEIVNAQDHEAIAAHRAVERALGRAEGRGEANDALVALCQELISHLALEASQNYFLVKLENIIAEKA